MPDMTRVRPAKAGELASALELLRGALPGDAPDPDRFLRGFVLDESFSLDGLIVVPPDAPPDAAVSPSHDGSSRRIASRVVAAVLAMAPSEVARRELGLGGDGWLIAGAVQPEHRRQGLGSELLDRAEAYLACRGCQRAVVAGFPPAYLTPGVDPARYPEALDLLHAHGYRTVSRPVAMDAGIATYSTPASVVASRHARMTEGWSFGPAEAGDLPEVIDRAGCWFSPDWGQAIRAAVRAHGQPHRVLLARDPAGELGGFATYGCYLSPVERFGPFGVRPSIRGGGIGRILLHDTLTAMRAEAAHSAWFLWTTEQSAAGHLYREAGFTVTRTFEVLVKDLPDPTSRGAATKPPEGDPS